VNLLYLFKSFFSKKINIEIVKNIVKNLKIYYLLSIFVFVLAIFSIFYMDDKITAYIITLKNSVALFFSSLGYILGQFQYVFLLNLILYFVFFKKQKKEKQKLVLASMHAMFFSGIFVQIPKYFIGRLRPIRGYDSFSWFNNYKLFGSSFFSHYNMSMPSGDTITISAAVIVFALYYKNVYVKVFFLLIPLITIFTRIYLSKHWFSDALIGLFLGYLIGKSVYEFYMKDVSFNQK